MPVPRKVLIRVVGAPLILAALGFILWLDYGQNPRLGTQGLLVAVAALCALEFYALCRARGIETAHLAGTIFAAAYMVPWTWIALKLGLGGARAWVMEAWRLLPIFPLLYVLLKLVFRFPRFTPEGAAFTMLGFGYVALLHLLLIPPPDSAIADWWYLIFLVAANKGSDMAAYGVGKSIGRHRMTPVLSPNKTWEGGVAGAAGGTAAGMAVLLATPLREGYPGAGVPALLFFALLVTIASQVGDLVESAFKRWAGVKDSGRLIPEFGGMLDMADSFLISIPVAHLLSITLT